jgi:hypothetical protein
MDIDGVDCADIPPRTTDCNVELTYMYNLVNVGDVSMDVTQLERIRGNQTNDLIDMVDPKFLPVGQSAKVTETEIVDFCDGGDFKTTVIAKADPPDGVPCESEAVYEFSAALPCKVDVSNPPCQITFVTLIVNQSNQLSLIPLNRSQLHVWIPTALTATTSLLEAPTVMLNSHTCTIS